MLQGNKPDTACMYVHTSFDTYSDRQALGLWLCTGEIALCCAVLCCAHGSGSQQHTRTYYCCTAVAVCRCSIKKAPKKMENKGSTLLYKVLEDMLVLTNSVCLLFVVALSSGMCERESTAKHGTARQGTTPHGAAPRGVELARS